MPSSTASTSFATVRAVAAASGVQQTATVAYDDLGRVSQRTAPWNAPGVSHGTTVDQ